MWDIRKVVVLFSLLHLNLVVCDDATETEQGQLLFAHVIYRHGDRTPVSPYPTDPWKDRIYWPEGFGQLTNVGKVQHYNLGQFLRKRYLNLLGNGTYLRDFVYIQSTDVDRTLMSAEANLAGLFPPGGHQIWYNDISWQPVPIHTIPEHLDFILAAKKPCPRYDYAMKKYQTSPEYEALLAKYKPLFRYLEENTGSPVNSFDAAEYLYNTLWIENLKNLTLPAWTKKVFVPGGDFEWITNNSFVVPTKTTELARLKAGFLIRDILDRFSDKIQSKLSPDRSFWIYSAHDTTVANVLNALGLFEPHSPPYASSILFELYKTVDNFYIQLFYKNSTNEQLSPLNIPNCGTKCDIEKFRDIYKSVIPSGDFDEECKLSTMSMTYEEIEIRGIDGSWIALVCLLVIASIITIACWKILKQERNLHSYNRL